MPLEHHSRNCCRHKSQMNAKVNKESFEKQYLHVLRASLQEMYALCGSLNKCLQIHLLTRGDCGDSQQIPRKTVAVQ